MTNTNTGMTARPSTFDYATQFFSENFNLTVEEFVYFFYDSEKILSQSTSHKIDGIFSEDVISNLNTSFLTYKFSSQYNFYTDNYEDTIKDNRLRINTETSLPNFYIYADNKNEDSTLYQKIVSYLDEIQILPSRSRFLSSDYFDKVAKVFKQSKVNPRVKEKISDISKLQDAIYFTKEGTTRLAEINENNFLSPFFSKIQFDTYKQNAFMGILEGAKFVDQFSKTVFNLEQTMQNKNLNIITDSFTNNVFTETNTIENCKTSLFKDIPSFFSELTSYIASSTDITFLGDTARIPPSRFENIINFNIAADRLFPLIENKKQTVEQFFSGKPISVEALMYEVSKIPLQLQDPKAANLAQKIYFPNLSSINKIQYNDSQVKFGNVYQYFISGYFFSLEQKLDIQLIIKLLSQLFNTTEEEATNLIKGNVDLLSPFFKKIVQQKQDTNRRELRIKIKQQKEFFIDFINFVIQQTKQDIFLYSPIIFKKPVIKDINAAFDSPPSWPEIEIDGVIGIDNKILIRLNSSISEIKQVPVLIQPEDQEIFIKNVVLQKKSGLSEKISFDGDDRIDYFQIFRIEEHPRNYQQFKNNFVTASTTITESNNEGSFNFEKKIKTNHSSYVDTLEPNKKYYYMFRSIDIHGNISNPSPVYQVEMINSDGTIYPIIKTVELLNDEGKTNSKNVRRFLYIAPNTLQSLINEKESGYFKEDQTVKEGANQVIDNTVLGILEEKVWNRKYRLKIKSKKTGKLVEIDFKFIHEKLQTIN